MCVCVGGGGDVFSENTVTSRVYEALKTLSLVEFMKLVRD